MATWTTMNDLSTGDLVTESDMDTLRGNIEYVLNPNKVITTHNNGSNYSTSSTSFVDVDASNLSITLTTNGGPVLILFSGSCYGGDTYEAHFDVTVDGTRYAASNTDGVASTITGINSDNARLRSFSILVDGLDAGSHTFTLQWKVRTGSAYMLSQTGSSPVVFQAIEL